MATKLTITADGTQAKQELAAVANAAGGVGTKAAEASAKTQGLSTATAAAGTAAKTAGLAFGWVGVVGGAVATLVSWFSRAKETVEKLGQIGTIAFQAISDAAKEASSSTSELQQQTALYNASLGDLNETIKSTMDATLAEAEAALEMEEARLRELRGLETVADRRRETLELILKKIKLDKQVAEAADMSGDMDRQRQTDQHSRMVGEISDRNQIVVLINQELAATKKLAAEGKLTADEAIAARKRLANLATRDAEIIREAESARLKAADAIKDKEEKARQDYLTALKKQKQEEADLLQKMRDEELEKDKQLKAEKLKLEKEALAESARIKEEARLADIERQKTELEKSGAVDAINKGASDPDAIANRLADRAASRITPGTHDRKKYERMEESRLDLGAQRDMKMQSGDTEGVAALTLQIQELESQQAHMKGQLEKERETVRRRAFRDAKRQQAGGRESFSDTDMAAAQQENAQAQIAAMQATGKFSQETLTALSQATAEQARTSTELAAMQDTLAEVQRQVNGTQQDGNRRRSQRNSSRQ